MKIKFLAILLCLVTVLSVFAGCQSKEIDEEELCRRHDGSIVFARDDLHSKLLFFFSHEGFRFKIMQKPKHYKIL